MRSLNRVDLFCLMALVLAVGMALGHVLSRGALLHASASADAHAAERDSLAAELHRATDAPQVRAVDWTECLPRTACMN